MKLSRFFIFCIILVLSQFKSFGENEQSKDSVIIKAGKLAYEGHYEESLSILLTEIKEAETLGDEKKIAKIYNSLAEVNRALKNFNQSLDYLKKAEVLFKLLADNQGLAATYNRFAAVFLEISNFPEFENYLMKSESICDKYSYDATKYNNLTLKAHYLLETEKEYDLALSKLQEALNLATVLKADEDKPMIYNNFATAYRKMENFDSAVVYAELSLKLSRNQNIKATEIAALAILAEVMESKKDYKSALYYERLFQQVNEQVSTINIQKNNAELAERYESEKKEKIIAQQKKFITYLTFAALLIVSGCIALFVYASRINKLNKALKLANLVIEEKSHELEAAGRLKDKLLTVLSHDLRSPLAAISSLLELMSNDGLTVEQSKSVILELNSRLSRTSQMLDNLLIWIKNQVQQMTPFKTEINIHELFDSIKHFFTHKLKAKQLELTIAIEGNPRIISDIEMLKAILRNLVSNAIKYSKSNTCVNLKYKTLQDGVEILVTDFGVGMETNKMNNLFNGSNFPEKGTNEELGIGVGLTIVKDFIERLGGTIEVFSNAGQGSTFKLTLKP